MKTIRDGFFCSDVEVRKHPTLPIQVRSDGLVSILTETCNQYTTWTTQSEFKCGWLKPQGYRCIEYMKKPYYIHELVAETFLGKRPLGMVIDHKDRNKQNNDYRNLWYCTRSENAHNSDKYEQDHSIKPLVYMDAAVRKFKRKLACHKYYLKRKSSNESRS